MATAVWNSLQGHHAMILEDAHRKVRQEVIAASLASNQIVSPSDVLGVFLCIVKVQCYQCNKKICV